MSCARTCCVSHTRTGRRRFTRPRYPTTYLLMLNAHESPVSDCFYGPKTGFRSFETGISFKHRKYFGWVPLKSHAASCSRTNEGKQKYKQRYNNEEQNLNLEGPWGRTLTPKNREYAYLTPEYVIRKPFLYKTSAKFI